MALDYRLKFFMLLMLISILTFSAYSQISKTVNSANKRYKLVVSKDSCFSRIEVQPDPSEIIRDCKTQFLTIFRKQGRNYEKIKEYIIPWSVIFFDKQDYKYFINNDGNIVVLEGKIGMEWFFIYLHGEDYKVVRINGLELFDMTLEEYARCCEELSFPFIYKGKTAKIKTVVNNTIQLKLEYFNIERQKYLSVNKKITQ